MLDLVIRGGDVVTPQGVGRWDVAVQGERIVAVGLPDPRVEAGRVLDATGNLVVPGGIEPHTHLAHFISMHPEDNLHTLGPEEDTRGMVFGGTTTHVDFCFVRPGTDIPQALETRGARWKGNSYTDYSFHVALQGQLPIKLFDQIPEAIQAGFPSFKVFTVEVLPPHPKRHPYRLDFGRIQLAMEKVAAHDGIMAVHAEDHDLVQFMYEKFREEKQTDGWLLPLVHNKLSELLAFRRTIQLAAHTGAGVYFVHTSAREGVEAVAEARAKGLPIYAETLQRFAEVTATNAARILGLYPQKGVIAPGSDADLVLIDPAIRKTLAREDFHVSDYSPWEGWPIQGWPVTTILRGRVVVEHGRLVGDALDGRL